MEWLKAIEAMAAPWWAYISWCMEADIQAPVCKPFWTWVAIACATAGTLGLAGIAYRIVSYRIKLAAALRAEEERQRMR